MSRTEEPTKTGVPARSATLVCTHCKGDSFHILIDISHKGIVAGDRYTPDRTDRFGAMECTACGELYYFEGRVAP